MPLFVFYHDMNIPFFCVLQMNSILFSSGSLVFIISILFIYINQLSSKMTVVISEIITLFMDKDHMNILPVGVRVPLAVHILTFSLRTNVLSGIKLFFFFLSLLLVSSFYISHFATTTKIK